MKKRTFCIFLVILTGFEAFSQSWMDLSFPRDLPQKGLEKEDLENAFWEFEGRINYWIRQTELQPRSVGMSHLFGKNGRINKEGDIHFDISFVQRKNLTLWDVVIVHELCHLKHFHHKSSFQKCFSDFLPKLSHLESENMYQKYFEKALAKARKGDVRAQFSVSLLYSEGKGVKKDEKKAFYWMKKAASFENADAWYHLGAMHLEGKGVKKNFETALLHLEKASKKNHPLAHYTLGAIFFEGVGGAKDFAKTKKHLKAFLSFESQPENLRENAAKILEATKKQTLAKR